MEKLVSKWNLDSSNLNKTVEKGLRMAEDLCECWASSLFDDKRVLQNLVFPEGILYNKQEDTVRTPKINSLFAPIPKLSGILTENKKSHLHKSDLNSHLVDPCSPSSNFLLLDLMLIADS